MKFDLHLDTSVSSNVQVDGMPVVSKQNGNPFLCSIRLGYKHRDMETVELKSAEIPVGFYNIRAPYNTFIINGVTYTVPPGNYTIDSLIDAMNTLIINSGSFSITGNFITFTVPTLYTMSFPFTFTNMTATGRTGPTSITYGSSNPGYGTPYAMVLGSGTTAGMQRWTVPITGTYTCVIAGAGNSKTWLGDNLNRNYYYTSYGAVVTITLSLTRGHVIRILVGQQGTQTTGLFSRGGGNGGTFIYNETTSSLLVAAGGGGGSASNTTNGTGGNGSAVSPYTDGNGRGLNGNTNVNGNGLAGRAANAGSGGTNGGGGGANTQGFGGQGGGGYSGDGAINTANGEQATAALAFLNGGIGGGNGTGPGGFGGGASAGTGTQFSAGSGGGGGYSGGGGGANNGNGEGGGGGGSWSATAWTSIVNTNSGMGYVTVNLVV